MTRAPQIYLGRSFYSEHLHKLPYERWGEPYPLWKGELWKLRNIHHYSLEEIKKDDEFFRKENSQALKNVIQDGYIKFPIFHENIYGELQEFSAWLPNDFVPSCSHDFEKKNGLLTNFYIPSYGRANNVKTAELFKSFGMKNYYICIDPSQYMEYRKYYPCDRLIIRDIEFRRNDMIDPHSSRLRPMRLSGHAPLCNFILSLSRSLGEEYFSFADDDIQYFSLKAFKEDYKFSTKKEKYTRDNFYTTEHAKPDYGFDFHSLWHNLENIAKLSRNIGFIGLERSGTIFSYPVEFQIGTRVFSLYISSTHHQISHSGWQNNDVITSIELSKRGLVNVLLEGFTYTPLKTQSGGGQTQMYKEFGSLDKGITLIKAEPNISKIVERFSRIHHFVDFSSYSDLRILPKSIIGNSPYFQ